MSQPKKQYWGVRIWVDFENEDFVTNSSTTEELNNLYGNFERALKSINHRYFIDGYVRGHGKVKDSNFKAINYLNSLTRKGDDDKDYFLFALENIPTLNVQCDMEISPGVRCSTKLRTGDRNKKDPYEVKSDVADLLLVRDMMFSCIDDYVNYNEGANVLLISNDVDFINMLTVLRKERVTTMLVVSDDIQEWKIKERKNNCINHIWKISDLKAGRRSL
ncbi:unnamed protein product [Cochlearia groenlandica]